MTAEDEVQVIKLLMGPYDNNCYILLHPGSGESIIVDAPSEPDTILDAVKGTKVQRIVITHSHRDHWGALEELKTRTSAPI
ncbi:MAG: fold metallo-hydrolase, partial [Dehalococcoidia bacterium]|nr:fold metallo-hydrolase [Dehalococcoidia bacterium]